MPTTKSEIRNWIESAKEENAKYMIVACDGFDHDDYPIFCDSVDQCREKHAEHNGKNMQTIMEVYDLSLPIEEQLNEFRAMHLPADSHAPQSKPQEDRSTLRDFQAEVREWAAATFPTQTPASIVEHLRREVEELALDQTPEEAADCFLLLLDYAELRGFDLLNEGIRKFKICKNRQWGAPDTYGVIEHIEPGAGGDDNPEGES